MNKARFAQVEDIHDRLVALEEEERAAFDNLLESLQNSERGESIEECADKLNEAIEALAEIIESRA
jgi:hypothetical protein